MTSNKIKRASFSLEPEYYELLREIARLMHTNMTIEIRRMIDERAVTLGLEPISPVARIQSAAPAKRAKGA